MLRVNRVVSTQLMVRRVSTDPPAVKNGSTQPTPKPFDTMPGPKSHKLFGTVLKYSKLFGGEYSMDRLHRNGWYNYHKYGPSVREEIIPNTNIVWIYRPEDIAMMYNLQGPHPQRRSHMAVKMFRERRKSVYPSAGLISSNYEDWKRLRLPSQQCLGHMKSIQALYIPIVNRIADRFLQRIDRKFVDIEPNECFLPELSRLFMEIMAATMFDIELECFSDAEMQADSFTRQLMHTTSAINYFIIKSDNGPHMWRYFDTPLYRKMKRHMLFLESVAIDFVNRHKTVGGNSVLSQMKKISDLTNAELITFACDALLGGVDTSAFSTAYLLYNLGKTMDKQQKLYDVEASKFLPRADSPVTGEMLDKAEYIKFCLKESFRLDPISIGVGRITARDGVFNGYFVPKGTSIVSQNQIACRLEQYFDNPNSFNPDRWVWKQGAKRPHPSLVLPFGFGPRACVARRLAEQNIYVVMLKLMRNFQVEWKGVPRLDYVTHLINKPEDPILLKFTRRNA